MTGRDAWRPAWILGGGLIASMAILAGVSIWLRRLDVAAQPQVLDGAATLVEWAELGWRFDAMIFSSFVAVATLILSRDPRQLFGWAVLIGVGVVSVLAMSTVSAILLSISGELPSELAPVLAAFLPPIGVAVSVGFLSVMALFPTGRPHDPRWRTPLRVFWAVGASVAFVAALAPGASWALTSERAWAFDNPIGVEALGWFDPLLVDLYTVGFAVFVIASVIARYRASDHEVRHQIKWVMVAAVIVVAASALPIQGPTVNYWLTVAGVPLPIALWIAVTKYRLYEIDRIISRTVTYTLVAAAIAAIYLLPILTLPRLLGESNDLVTAASTLAAAAVFNPLRRRTQRAVDRRFNRARYHTEQEIDAYATRLADHVDLHTVTTDLQTVVARTLTPTTTSTWIRHHHT